MAHDIWNPTPGQNEPLKLADLPEAPETYDEFYQQFDWYPVEQPPTLEDYFEKMMHDRFVDSLANLVRRVDLRGHYTPSISSKHTFSEKLNPIGSLDVYMYLKLGPHTQSDIARKTKYKPGFCDELGIENSISQPTVSRIEERVETKCPSWSDYFDRVKHNVITKARGTEYEDWFEPPPEVRFDGAEIPEVKEISRKLRRYVYPFIKLDRGEEVKYSKDSLLKILAAAGRWGCQPNQAAESVGLKPWNHGRDVPDTSSLFYNIWPMKREQVIKMFVVCHEALYRFAEDYEDFGGGVEVAIDITDWPTFGDPDASDGISGTKPGRNFSHAWQYATLSVVGDRVPMTLAAMPVRRRKNSNIAMRRLFTYADSKFDIDTVYVDRDFYAEKTRKVCDDFDVSFVMKAKEQADTIDDLKDAAISMDEPYRKREWGVSDWPNEDYMWVMPSEKRANRRTSEPDHPRDDWITFYSDKDPDVHGAEKLAADYRKRWAVETKYRVLKYRFLPQCASNEGHIRAFIVNYAALLYNMWQVANLIADDSDDDADLDDGYIFNANYFLGSIVDDSRDIEIAEVGDLSEHSEVLQDSVWF